MGQCGSDTLSQHTGGDRSQMQTLKKSMWIIIIQNVFIKLKVWLYFELSHTFHILSLRYLQYVKFLLDILCYTLYHKVSFTLVKSRSIKL